MIRHELVGSAKSVTRLTAAGRLARGIVACEPLGRHVVREVVPGPETADDAAWAEYVQATAWRGDHPCGTCPHGHGQYRRGRPATPGYTASMVCASSMHRFSPG